MSTSGEPPRFARLPVLAIAAVAGGLLLWTSTRYGHGFDETYFVVAGRDHLSWGYFDQPPLVPLLAAGLDGLFPGSLLALRLPVTLAAVGGILLTALIARELGGCRGAQAMAAAFYAMSSVVTISHWLATYSLDPVLWTLIAWLLVRWVRRRDSDRPLFWAGVVTAVSLEVKFLIPAFGCSCCSARCCSARGSCCAAARCGSGRWWPSWRRCRRSSGRPATTGRTRG